MKAAHTYFYLYFHSDYLVDSNHPLNFEFALKEHLPLKLNCSCRNEKFDTKG